MSWLQLDSQGIAGRVAADTVELPKFGTFVRRGIVGFTLLSVAGFAPWALTGRWFYRNVGETGLYVVCALVFIGLSGPLLHRLILGPGSLRRFYKLFGVTFAAYALLWIVGWMSLRGHAGSLLGLFAGTAAMGWMLAWAFGAKTSAIKIIAALFTLNAAGYFIGGWVEAAVMTMKNLSMPRPQQVALAKLLWGVCYGVGFGAGLGAAYYWCQTAIRGRLRESKQTED